MPLSSAGEQSMSNTHVLLLTRPHTAPHVLRKVTGTMIQLSLPYGVWAWEGRKQQKKYKTKCQGLTLGGKGGAQTNSKRQNKMKRKHTTKGKGKRFDWSCV